MVRTTHSSVPWQVNGGEADLADGKRGLETRCRRKHIRETRRKHRKPDRLTKQRMILKMVSHSQHQHAAEPEAHGTRSTAARRHAHRYRGARGAMISVKRCEHTLAHGAKPRARAMPINTGRVWQGRRVLLVRWVRWVLSVAFRSVLSVLWAAVAPWHTTHKSEPRAKATPMSRMGSRARMCRRRYHQLPRAHTTPCGQCVRTRCFRGVLGSRKRTLAHDAELRARATPTSRMGRRGTHVRVAHMEPYLKQFRRQAKSVQRGHPVVCARFAAV